MCGRVANDVACWENSLYDLMQAYMMTLCVCVWVGALSTCMEKRVRPHLAELCIRCLRWAWPGRSRRSYTPGCLRPGCWLSAGLCGCSSSSRCRPCLLLPAKQHSDRNDHHLCVQGWEQKKIHCQNAAAQLLTKSRKRDHVSPLLDSLHWLSVSFRIDFKTVTLPCKVLYRVRPQAIWWTYWCLLSLKPFQFRHLSCRSYCMTISSKQDQFYLLNHFLRPTFNSFYWIYSSSPSHLYQKCF